MGRTAVANPSFALATLVMIILYAEICQGGVFNSDGSSYGNQDGYEDEEFENFESGPFLPVVPGIGMGLDPSQLQNLLSSFGEPEVYDIPAVSEHVYGSPSKVNRHLIWWPCI